jgi:uncharacterized membrane protein
MFLVINILSQILIESTKHWACAARLPIKELGPEAKAILFVFKFGFKGQLSGLVDYSAMITKNAASSKIIGTISNTLYVLFMIFFP